MAKKSADYAVESSAPAPTAASLTALDTLAAAATALLSLIDSARPPLAAWVDAEAGAMDARRRTVEMEAALKPMQDQITQARKDLDDDQQHWAERRSEEQKAQAEKLETYRLKVEADLAAKQRTMEDNVQALKRDLVALTKEREAMQPDIAHLRATIADLRATLASLKAGIPS
jgi:predicted  nucleic acid-binding Zn-ribbon protein